MGEEPVDDGERRPDEPTGDAAGDDATAHPDDASAAEETDEGSAGDPAADATSESGGAGEAGRRDAADGSDETGDADDASGSDDVDGSDDADADSESDSDDPASEDGGAGTPDSDASDERDGEEHAADAETEDEADAEMEDETDTATEDGADAEAEDEADDAEPDDDQVDDNQDDEDDRDDEDVPDADTRSASDYGPSRDVRQDEETDGDEDRDGPEGEEDRTDQEDEVAAAGVPDDDGVTAPAARTDGSHAAGAEVGVPDPVEDGATDDGYGPQPPDDEEMPLTVHIEEMVNRLAVVLFAVAIITLAAFPFASEIILTIWEGVLPRGDAPPHVYGPLEKILTELKLASLAGIVLALPVFVYETYLFMRPGLYPHERRYYIAAVPTSLVLALVGVAFAYFLILPMLFTYFMYYSDVTAAIAFGLQDTFNLIVVMMGLMAIVFQIPLFIMLAIMMGITSRAWLEGNRIIFWSAFAGVAVLFSPDPTGMAPLAVGLTMVVLFEGTLALLRWTGR